MKFCKKFIKKYPQFDLEMYFVVEYHVRSDFNEYLEVVGYPSEHLDYLLATETEDDGRYDEEIKVLMKGIDSSIPSQLKFIKDEGYGVGYGFKLNED